MKLIKLSIIFFSCFVTPAIACDENKTYEQSIKEECDRGVFKCSDKPENICDKKDKDGNYKFRHKKFCKSDKRIET